MLKKEDKGIYTYTEIPIVVFKVKTNEGDGCTGCYFHTKYGRKTGYCQKQLDRDIPYEECKGYIYILPMTFEYWGYKEKDLVD